MNGLERTQAAGIPAFLRNELAMTVADNGELMIRKSGETVQLTPHEVERLRSFLEKTSSVRRG